MYKGPKTTMYIVRSLNMVNWLCSHGFKILKVEDCFYIDKYERLDKQNISTEHIDSAFLI